jgi:hypothetical protein
VGVHIGCQSLRLPSRRFWLTCFYFAYDTRGNDVLVETELCLCGTAFGIAREWAHY